MIKLYDRVLLKDGNEASIIEIFEEEKSFLADIDRNGDTDTDEISIDDIKNVIGKNIVKIISLIEYDEFGKDMGFPSIKDSFNEEPYEGQNDIIKYLKTKGTKHVVSIERVLDIVTGEVIMHENWIINDGKFSWNSKLIYYVENYNMRLPNEFEDYVKNFKKF